MNRPAFRIGVVTTVLPKNRVVRGKSVVAPILHFRRMASRAAEKGAVLMLFSPEAVDWGERKVFAWVPQNSQQPFGPWVHRELPLPHVFYENVFVHLAVKGYTSELRRHARQHGIPLFNPPLYNKWQMGEWLKTTDVKRYIPDGIRCSNAERVVELTNQWSEAYFKPMGGYGGMGVTRIQVARGGRYRVSIDRQHNGKRVRQHLTKTEFQQFIRRRLNVVHFLQKGISLLTIQDRKVDFRVVTHRGAGGKWTVVGIIPKLAAADGVVTNLVAGGERMTLEQLVSLAKREDKTIPVRDLEASAQAISNQISKRFPMVGLLGYDLGVDRNGNVWMIEVNPKPARSLLQPHMKEQIAKEATDFALFLAKKYHRGERKAESG